MEPPVNFENLHAITGGDEEVEAALFASFLEDTGACLESMRVAYSAGDEVLWRQQAHALKGACINLGAQKLGDLCCRAQMSWQASSDDKYAILQEIEGEFQRVRDVLAKSSG